MQNTPLPSRNTLLLLLGGFALLIFITFSPVFGNGFVILDDGLLIYENNIIREISLQNFHTIFTSFDPELYIPLTIFSYQIDYLVGGYSPFIYHLNNLLLHILSTFLVFTFILILTKRKLLALFCGVFFAIHPLQTEAVVWAAARKDLLSAAFFFLSLVCYLLYRRGERGRLYIFSLLAFLLGLLAKVSIITLPIILLLIDWYEERGWTKKMFTEKIPFFMLSIIFGFIALVGKAAVLDDITMLEKILVAPKSVVFYFTKFLFPFRLSVFYPHLSEISILSSDILVPAIFLFLLLLALYSARKMGKEVLFATLFFLITLAPSFIAISKGGNIFFASDRYAYIPAVGIFLLIGALFFNFMRSSYLREDRAGKRTRATVLMRSRVRPEQMRIGIMVVAVVFALITFRQTLLWGGSTRLFERATSVSPEFYLSHINLGASYRLDGRIDDAIEEFRIAISLHPMANTHGLLAQVYAESGDMELAISEFKKGLSIDPNEYELHHGLGQVYVLQGRTEEALQEYERSLELMPEDSNAYRQLARRTTNARRDVVYERIGIVYGQRGDHEKAITYYNKALTENPYFADAHYNMAVALGSLRRTEEAIFHYERTVRLAPLHLKALVNLGVLYASTGKKKEAAIILKKALKIDPQNAAARTMLGKLGT